MKFKIVTDDIEKPREVMLNILDKYREKIEKQSWVMPIVTIPLFIGVKEELEKILSEFGDKE